MMLLVIVNLQHPKIMIKSIKGPLLLEKYDEKEMKKHIWAYGFLS